MPDESALIEENDGRLPDYWAEKLID